MSQHTYQTLYKSRPIHVTLGYDRPLDYVFMTVLLLDAADHENDVIYSNLDDPDAGTECDDVNYFRRILHDLEITVPETMFAETMRDQKKRVGNRMLNHT